jgi:LuxR family maltose regulon positive regulatory protein
VKQLDLPVAWLSLDENDDDLARFLAYLCAAVQKAVPGVGGAALEVLRSSERAPVENVVAALINDLAAAPGEFVLVLDDYHTIQSSAVHQAMALLVERQPAQMHLVIATRSDPRLPLARLRAQGRVTELRMEQLRFTPDEVADYLNRLMRLGLSPADLATLLERTEGWIASLQMAALSLQDHPDKREFIRDFSGSQRFILDYLVEEVLNRQPASVQSFLLQTCILDRFCAALCAELCRELTVESQQLTEESRQVTVYSSQFQEKEPLAKANCQLSTDECQPLLESLERDNLFIVPLDEERRWYRYHHLFAGLLRARLANSTPAGISQTELHRRASAWYERNGFREEAIRHALAAQDHPRAARLVEEAAEGLFLGGEYARLSGWVQTLPVEETRSRPWLCTWVGWSYSLTGALPEAQRWTGAAEKATASRSGLPIEEVQALREQIAALQVLNASLAEDYPLALELAGPALADPPAQRTSSFLARCSILHALSSLSYPAGEMDKTEETCLETMRIASEAGFLLRFLHAANKLAHTYITCGQLHRCLELLEESLDFLEQRGSQDYFTAGQIYSRWSDLLYQWGRLEEAERVVQKSFALNERVQIPYLMVDNLDLSARLLTARGDYPVAQEALEEAARLIRRSYIWPTLVWQHEMAQVRLWLASGDLGRATAWAAEHERESPLADPMPFSQEATGISCARIRLALGQAGTAARALERLAVSARAGGRKGSLVEILTLQALALQAGGDLPGALAALHEALELGQPEGYLRSFLEAGPAATALTTGASVEALLAKIGKEPSPHQAYARRLLAAFPGVREGPEQAARGHAPAIPGPAENRCLVEPLSARELEVLHCMAAGLSNHEIAQHLVIAVSTVKRHVNHIFDKLGVKTRTRALAEARQAGLI